MRIVIWLVCCCVAVLGFAEEEPQETLVLSTPDQLAALTSEPSYLVGGLINPMSGHLALRQTDLIAKGAQEIALTRVYIPPSMPCSFPKHERFQEEYDKKYLYNHLVDHYKGWQFFPHLRLQYYPTLAVVRISEPNGATFDFKVSNSTTLVSPAYAISNFNGEVPNGKYDPRNTRIAYEDRGNKIVVHASDGTVRFYEKKAVAIKTYYLFLLQKEILPNGKVLKYHYNKWLQPVYVESLDPQERYVYASLRISGFPKQGSCHFLTSSGLTADYGYQTRRLQAKLRVKIKGGHLDEDFRRDCPPILSSVSSPFYQHEVLDYCGRFLLASYSGKDCIFIARHGGFGDEPHYRIDKLSLPVGPNDTFQPVYDMHYYPPIAGKKEGSTHVSSSDGTYIIYHFSKNLLSSSVQYFGQDGSLKNEKVFSWNEQNWLKTLEMRDHIQNVLYRKSYEYDRFGNPIVEAFSGDLTGHGTLETFITKRTFSEEGRHLLLREESEDGKIVCCSYLPNTNLIASKLIKNGDQIILREFSVYDDCNNFIQKISDDGMSEDRNNLSNVTQRTLTNYSLRQSAPFLHLPEWIDEKYWEAGSEKSLKKIHVLYDQHGNIAQEEVYDAEGCHAYTICKTYNERGDVLTETNRLGQQAVYTYDAKGRLETSTNFSRRINKTFQHDTKGRIRTLTETGDDGIVHAYSSEYDFHDRQIHKKDAFQNNTRFIHDPLLNKIVKTDFPSIISEDGCAVTVATSSTYDPFGRELTKADANGNVTAYRYNAYGSLTEILHPNGGREYFRYEKNGQCVSYTDPDGLTIYYKNDILGRILSKTYASAEGKIQAEEIYTYSGFQLLTATDKEGNLRQYSYDGLGRKIRETFCGQVTDFSYDALGWLETTRLHNEGNTLLTHYKRDLEGKILETLKTDVFGHPLYKIRYSYDKDGNQETVTRHINGKEAVDTFVYDSFSRLIRHTDAEGYSSITVYDENCINALGQKVLRKTTIDPLHIATIQTQDALSRVVRKELLNPQGITISCEDRIYDPQGNLTYRKDYVFENDRHRNTQTVKHTYTSMHDIGSITRAFGTKDARTTSYTYLPSGKRATKSLPDGVTLVYSYHPLGFMSRLDSSDGTIHHVFDYDKLGHLRYAHDENLKIDIQREVDSFGNVTSEAFPNNLELKKGYDAFNRAISVKIANQGEILYTYDPLYLRQVTRTSEKGDYTHFYAGYDLGGNLISEDMIGGLGRIAHSHTPTGRKKTISSPYFSQSCHYDSVGNLVTNIADVEHQYSYDSLSQLSVEKSPEYSIAYTHDSLYNRIQKNADSYEVNNLNELASLNGMLGSYDLRGNQILREHGSEIQYLIYDALNRLTEVTSAKKKINFIYDPLGRRLSKTVYTQADVGWTELDHEYYLYDGYNEIGAFSAPNTPKNIKILGASTENPSTIGIEVNGQVFAPILDVQGNVRRLIDLDTKAVAIGYNFTAFGEPLHDAREDDLLNPWRFAAKRFEPELGIVDFGKRYYDPCLGRWLTTDPAGFADSINLYQYVLNNPFRYRDPRGDSLAGYCLGLGEIILGGAIMIAGGIVEVGSFGTLSFGFVLAESTGIALIGQGLTLTAMNAEDLSFEKRSSRPDPDPRAEGYPHTIILIPGATGSYTTHNGDGTYKQYRGSGKPHGGIPRPNVKENEINQSPTGPKPGSSKVREAKADEIPNA